MRNSNLYFIKSLVLGILILATITSCTNTNVNTEVAVQKDPDSLEEYVAQRLPIYEKVRLSTDLNLLTANERKILPLLIEAAKIMDELFWKQAYPQRDSLMATIKDEKTRSFVDINYGPWDRLNGDKPFVAGVGEKPLGGNFYPLDMTKEELEISDVRDKQGLYSMVRREQGKLVAIPYHTFFAAELQRASSLLKQAA